VVEGQGEIWQLSYPNIEINTEKREKLLGLAGVEVIIGDGSDEELLKRAGLEDAGVFISLTGNE